MAEEVKLLAFLPSPFSGRVEIALKMKGVEYERVEQDLADKSPLLIQYNPVYKKIPVLLHNGKPICESIVILEYIDETWEGTPILPEDPHEKAAARFWAKFIDEKCVRSVWQAAWIRGEEQEKAIEEARENLKTLECQLEGKKFFGGDTIGLVDIAANFIAFWVEILQEVNGIELLTEERLPALCKWADEFVNSSVVKGTLPPREVMVNFSKSFQHTPTGAKYK